MPFGAKCGLLCFCSACHVGSDSACMSLHIYDSFAETTETAGASQFEPVKSLKKDFSLLCLTKPTNRVDMTLAQEENSTCSVLFVGALRQYL